MSSPCLDELRMDSFLSDSLERADRAAATDHVRSCADCRLRALEGDPAGRVPAGALPGALRLRGRDPADPGERARRDRDSPGLAQDRAPGGELARDAADRRRARRGRPAFAHGLLADVAASRRAASPAQGSSPAPSAFVRAAASERSDDALAPATATVYEWNPGANSPDDPKIVWIVDRSLDL